MSSDLKKQNNMPNISYGKMLGLFLGIGLMLLRSNIARAGENPSSNSDLQKGSSETPLKFENPNHLEFVPLYISDYNTSGFVHPKYGFVVINKHAFASFPEEMSEFENSQKLPQTYSYIDLSRFGLDSVVLFPTKKSQEDFLEWLKNQPTYKTINKQLEQLVEGKGYLTSYTFNNPHGLKSELRSIGGIIPSSLTFIFNPSPNLSSSSRIYTGNIIQHPVLEPKNKYLTYGASGSVFTDPNKNTFNYTGGIEGKGIDGNLNIKFVLDKNTGNYISPDQSGLQETSETLENILNRELKRLKKYYPELKQYTNIRDYITKTSEEPNYGGIGFISFVFPSDVFANIGNGDVNSFFKPGPKQVTEKFRNNFKEYISQLYPKKETASLPEKYKQYREYVLDLEYKLSISNLNPEENKKIFTYFKKEYSLSVQESKELYNIAIDEMVALKIKNLRRSLVYFVYLNLSLSDFTNGINRLEIPADLKASLIDNIQSLLYQIEN